jgi:hypothetical protein
LHAERADLKKTYVESKTEAAQSYAEWRKYWDEWHMKRRKHNRHWQKQNSYLRSIDKTVQTLRERYGADIESRGPYPLIRWSSACR